MNKKGLDEIKKLITKLYDIISVDSEFSIDFKDDILNIELNTEDSGIVIGHHGEVLEALQLITSLMISKKTGEFVRVNIEVGDYKRNREEYLKDLADKIRSRVVEENREQVVSSLKPWERRIVHLYLQDDPDVISESVGEGRERVLIIKPK